MTNWHGMFALAPATDDPALMVLIYRNGNRAGQEVAPSQPYVRINAGGKRTYVPKAEIVWELHQGPPPAGWYPTLNEEVNPDPCRPQLDIEAIQHGMAEIVLVPIRPTTTVPPPPAAFAGPPAIRNRAARCARNHHCRLDWGLFYTYAPCKHNPDLAALYHTRGIDAGNEAMPGLTYVHGANILQPRGKRAKQSKIPKSFVIYELLHGPVPAGHDVRYRRNNLLGSDRMPQPDDLELIYIGE